MTQLTKKYTVELKVVFVGKECDKQRVRHSNDLILSEDMKTIVINGEKAAFLQYDNENKFVNRILIFLSDQATDILKLSVVWCIDFSANYLFYNIFNFETNFSRHKLWSYDAL